MGKTGALVLATCAGNIQRGRHTTYRERIEKNQQIEWHWPIYPPDHEDYDEAHAVPKGWRVLVEKLGEGEWAERMQKARAADNVVDPEKARYEGRELEKGRGYSEEDKRIVNTAVASLRDSEDDHWTSRGEPLVEAVQFMIDKATRELDETVEPPWPEWAERKVINGASQRRRVKGS